MAVTMNTDEDASSSGQPTDHEGRDKAAAPNKAEGRFLAGIADLGRLTDGQMHIPT